MGSPANVPDDDNSAFELEFAALASAGRKGRAESASAARMACTDRGTLITGTRCSLNAVHTRCNSAVASRASDESAVSTAADGNRCSQTPANRAATGTSKDEDGDDDNDDDEVDAGLAAAGFDAAEDDGDNLTATGDSISARISARQRRCSSASAAVIAFN